MGFLFSNAYRVDGNFQPGARNMANYPLLVDWAHFGRTAVADFNSLSAGTILQDYTDIGSPATTRDAGGAANYSAWTWTGGTPTASASGVLAAVQTTVEGAGFRLDTANLDPAKRYRFVFMVGGESSFTGAEISLSDASADPLTVSLENSGTAMHEIEVYCQPDAAAYLRFDYTLTSADSAPGRAILQGVYVEEFPFELVLHDQFTDTNGTGIEDHTPDDVDFWGGLYPYEAVGATSLSAAVTGSGGISVQGNQLQYTTGAQRARHYTGAFDNAISVRWVTTATSGHRIGVSSRHEDKGSQLWHNLREPNDDYSTYQQHWGDPSPHQTNLTGTAQAKTFNTSAEYYVRCTAIGLRLTLEVDGQLVDARNLTVHDVVHADGVAFGVEGIATNNFFDEVIVFSALNQVAAAAEAAVAFGVLQAAPVSISGAALGASAFGVTVGRAPIAVDISAGAQAAAGLSVAQLAGVNMSNAADAGEAVERAGGVQAVDTAQAAEAGEQVQTTLRALGDIDGNVNSDLVNSVTQAANVDAGLPAEADETMAGNAGQFADVANAAEALADPAVQLVAPVSPAPHAGDASSTTAATGNFAVDVDNDAEAGYSPGSTLQGEISVDFQGDALAGLNIGATAQLGLEVSFSGLSSVVYAAVVQALRDISAGGDGDMVVSRPAGTVISVDMTAAGLAGDAQSVALQAITQLTAAAVGELVGAAVQHAVVDLVDGTQGTFTATGILDTDRIVISGEVRIVSQTPWIRIRRLDRDGLM